MALQGAAAPLAAANITAGAQLAAEGWQELQQPPGGSWAQAWCEARGVGPAASNSSSSSPSNRAGSGASAWHSVTVPPLTVLVSALFTHAAIAL